MSASASPKTFAPPVPTSTLSWHNWTRGSRGPGVLLDGPDHRRDGAGGARRLHRLWRPQSLVLSHDSRRSSAESPSGLLPERDLFYYGGGLGNRRIPSRRPTPRFQSGICRQRRRCRARCRSGDRGGSRRTGIEDRDIYSARENLPPRHDPGFRALYDFSIMEIARVTYRAQNCLGMASGDRWARATVFEVVRGPETRDDTPGHQSGSGERRARKWLWSKIRWRRNRATFKMLI